MSRIISTFILESRNLSNIQRFNTIYNSRKQSVAEHSYYVTLLSLLLTEELQRDHNLEINTLDVIKYSLYHDIGEIYTGDIPFPYKKSGYYSSLSEKLYLAEKFNYISDPKFSVIDYVLEENQLIPNEESQRLEFRIFKLCDMLELSIHCVEDYERGNSRIEQTLYFSIDYILKNFRDIVDKSVTVKALIEKFTENNKF